MSKSRLNLEELNIIIDILTGEIETAKIIESDIVILLGGITSKNYKIETIKKLRNRVRKVYRDTMLD